MSACVRSGIASLSVGTEFGEKRTELMVGLTSLRLQNFKSWRDTGDIRLAPITALFGTNSSGKTSLLQSLLLLRQTSESPDRNRVLDLGGGPGSLVDLGTVSDLIHGHDPEGQLSMSLAWHDDEPFVIQDPLAQARKVKSIISESRVLSLTTEVVASKTGFEVVRTEYGVGETTFAMSRQDAKRVEYELTSNTFPFVRNPGRAWKLPRPARFYGFPDQVRLYYQNASFLSDLELKFEQRLSRIRYLGPLRDDPKRQYIFAGGTPGDVGQRGEQAVDALVAADLAEMKVTRGRDARGHRLPAISVQILVASWLKELDLIDSFAVRPLDERSTVYLVEVKRSASSPPVLLTDVGFGVSQVLPVLVLLAYASEGDTVLLEQPEIHLHPSVQSGLADILIETALARNVQVVVESHSEHLLARLQRRMAEHQLDRGLELTPREVAVYFVDCRSAQSSIVELEFDIFGNIENWPKNFFGDRSAEILASLEAQADRTAN
jgi:predicted ATPase